MITITIIEVKHMEKSYYFIQLNKKLYNQITDFLDIYLINDKMKSRIGYYHDKKIKEFLYLAVNWVTSFEMACNNNHYINTSMGFTPNLNAYKIIYKKTKTFFNYEIFQKFLLDFFDYTWNKEKYTWEKEDV